MVASSAKTVLLCAPCPDPDPKNSEKDNTQMSLEVSKVTTQARPMTSSEIKAANLNISDLIKWFKDLFKNGKIFYDKVKAAKIIDKLKAVGYIISGIWTILGHDPIAEGLNDLNKEVKQLAEKMTRSFNDMKAFISEVKFLEKVITPASILIKYMMDCINHPGPEALENFKNAYSRHSPLMIMSTIVTNLEQKSTNPVRLAMDNAVSQTATFTKWLTLIENVLGQLLILEAFATGLLKTQSRFNCEQILEETIGVQKTMDDLKAEYGFDNYWDEFKIWLESMARQNADLPTKTKMIRTQLNTYKTTDSFYIIVAVKDEHFKKDWFLHKFVCEDQFIEITTPNEYYLVYRSLFANLATEAEMEKMREEVDSVKLKGIDEDAHRKLTLRQFKNSGLTALVGDDTWFIDWANCPNNVSGPGWFTREDPFSGPPVCALIVGFR